VAAEVADGECIFLDSGTTCVEVARLLVGRRLTVMTVSLHAADVLGDSESITTIVAGGVLRPHERTMIGHEAESLIRSLRFDRAVLGACGITPRDGLTAFDLSDAAVKRTAMESAMTVTVAATGDKLLSTAMAVVAPAGELDEIVTDQTAPSESVDELRARGVDVIVVEHKDGKAIT
jgi:DeoR/GlpR family transcriptional regulator of sugar metabolism